MSSAPPSEPPSAAGNFESFLLHRVIFVSAGPRTSKRPPRLSSPSPADDAILLFQPGERGSFLSTGLERASLRRSDNATSKAFTPLWLPKWNNFFNSRIYAGGPRAPPPCSLSCGAPLIATRHFSRLSEPPAENISQPPHPHPPFHQPLLLLQELVDFSFKSTCLKLRLPHFIYRALGISRDAEEKSRRSTEGASVSANAL